MAFLPYAQVPAPTASIFPGPDAPKMQRRADFKAENCEACTAWGAACESLMKPSSCFQATTLLPLSVHDRHPGTLRDSQEIAAYPTKHAEHEA